MSEYKYGDLDPTPAERRGSKGCGELHGGFICTRPKGHGGMQHIAGTGHKVVCVWPVASDEPEPETSVLVSYYWSIEGDNWFTAYENDIPLLLKRGLKVKRVKVERRVTTKYLNPDDAPADS